MVGIKNYFTQTFHTLNWPKTLENKTMLDQLTPELSGLDVLVLRTKD